MLTFKRFLSEQLKDAEFKKEWDALVENERNETKKKLRTEIAAQQKNQITFQINQAS